MAIYVAEYLIFGLREFENAKQSNVTFLFSRTSLTRVVKMNLLLTTRDNFFSTSVKENIKVMRECYHIGEVNVLKVILDYSYQQINILSRNLISRGKEIILFKRCQRR